MRPAQLDEIYRQDDYTNSNHIPFSYIEFLGRGSFGVVDKVRRTSGPFQGRIYARKVIMMPADELGREKVRTALRKEIDIVKRLQHLHSIAVRSGLSGPERRLLCLAGSPNLAGRTVYALDSIAEAPVAGRTRSRTLQLP